MVDFKTLNFSVNEGLAHIELNRPEAANAMDKDVMEELMHAAIRCDSDDSIRAVLLTSTGKLFSAGGDLAWFGRNLDTVSALLKEATTYVHSAISHFHRMNKPLVIAVQGAAAGAGFSLAIAGDYVMASEKASFTMAYTAAGLSPDGGASYYLPRLVGERRAKELMLTNRKLSAVEAVEWGMINEVVAVEELQERAEKLARKLANGPTQAFATVKRLLDTSLHESLETQMQYEAQGISRNAAGVDGQEGISAFLAKRKPEFVGR